MYKMICLDIDGTLLNSQHKITAHVKDTVQKAAARGIHIILVSARMPAGILPFIKELAIKAPTICYSGALILDEAQKPLQANSISVAALAAIYNTCKKNAAHLSIYHNGNWYVESMDSWATQESTITQIIPTIAAAESLLSKWQSEATGPNKLLCMGEPEKIAVIAELLNRADMTIYRSKPTYLEMVSHTASKTNAIQFLAQRYKINMKEIMTIGDNYNDIDMLQAAGLGVAMGNAPDDVKSQAKIVTASNDKDGVAIAIEKYGFA
jgi:hypothetical protein